MVYLNFNSAILLKVIYVWISLAFCVDSLLYALRNAVQGGLLTISCIDVFINLYSSASHHLFDFARQRSKVVFFFNFIYLLLL